MVDAVIAGLSGLKAAERRLEVSTNNIANFQSTTTIEDGQLINRPYQPSYVIQISDTTGGTRTLTSPIDPPTIPSFDPDAVTADENGIVQLPNVDLAKETVNQISAKAAYQSSLATIQKSEEVFDELLNIII